MLAMILRILTASSDVRADVTSNFGEQMTPRKLRRLIEIAQLLGVSKQRADQLRRQEDFPDPVDRWARGDLWAAADVRRWART